MKIIKEHFSLNLLQLSTLFILSSILVLVSCNKNEIHNTKDKNQNPAQKEKTNIVIFYVDDLGYQLPCYGDSLISTPNISQIARSGVLFEQGYSASCVCSPSRAALLTGQYPARTGYDANTRNPSEALNTSFTIASHLKENGYKTGIIGKWHLGHFTPEQLPLHKGFDYFHGNSGNIANKKHKYYHQNDPIPQIKDHPATSIYWANQANSFIDLHKENPFFLFLSFSSMHRPWSTTTPLQEKTNHISDPKKKKFAASLYELDLAIGQVLQQLKKEGIEENTLIFFLSDHGSNPLNNSPLKGGKWNLFEGGIRVPFLMQWKGKIKENQRIQTPISQLDIFPTIQNIIEKTIDLNVQHSLDGKDLMPLINGSNSGEFHSYLYWRFGTQYAIRQGDWKLIQAYSDLDQPALYDLKNDPNEEQDVFSQNREIANHLTKEYEKWSSKMKLPRWEDKRWIRNSNQNQ